MHHKFVIFPFSAIVGQEKMKRALLLNAIDPTIGGVLIKGDKGTGKSTAVRALADILPKIRVVKDCPFNCHPENPKLMCRACQERYKVEGGLPWMEKRMEVIDMPLSATEDMVVGSLDIKRALREGIKALEPGILARANRNILYIDEVNLLDDHLVNILLDVAAMGVNIIEREGVSVYHPSRFILVGTMNPEEGSLRPQLLDRFGLSVEVSALLSKEERLRIMEYRRLFDQDPWEFERMFENAQNELRERVLNAQALLPKVSISQKLLEKIVEISIAFGIKTHRADIVMEKTSRAIAALDGRTEVTEDDIKEAAMLALPHRLKQRPFERETPIQEEILEKIIRRGDENEREENEMDRNLRSKRIEIDMKTKSPGGDFPKSFGSTRGLYVRAIESKNPKSVAVDATIKRAVRETGKLTVLPEHLMEKLRISKGDVLYIILLDTSSSMRAERKIKFARSLSGSLLNQSYEKKSLVSLMVFRDSDAELLVPPTKDISKVEEYLENLKTGGKTPLTPAMIKAIELARTERKASPVIVLISDGRGNVFANGSLEQDLSLISSNANDIKFVFINTESRYKSIGLLEKMAQLLDAAHFYLDEIMPNEAEP